MNELELGWRTLKWLMKRREVASYERKRKADLRKEISGLVERLNNGHTTAFKTKDRKFVLRDFDQPILASLISPVLGNQPVAALAARFTEESHPRVRVTAITPFGIELLAVLWDTTCEQIDSFSYRKALDGVFKSGSARLTVLRDMMTQLCTV